MTTSPILSLPYLLPQQAQKHVTVNEALQRLDALVQISVASRTQVIAPTAPDNGARYLGPNGLSGDWEGYDRHLIIRADETWIAILPLKGWLIWVEDEQKLLVFDGTDWQNTITGIDRLGINASADDTNRFVIKGDASLLDHNGTDHRLKINKATIADTATMAFQSNHQTLAEIGLAGDNALAIKVSPDGTAFASVLTFLTDGAIGAGTTTPSSRLHIKENADARLTIDTAISDSGGGFDIVNSGSGQSWRVTGQTNLLKFRDHTAGLDKLILNTGSDGDVIITNCGNIGIGKSTPSARLDVDGAVRVGTYTTGSLPSASLLGAGTILYVSNAPGGASLAFSDGTNWRQAKDNTVLS